MILFLVLLSVVSATLGTPVVENVHYKTVDNEFLEKQTKILNLLTNVVELSHLTEYSVVDGTLSSYVKWLQQHKNEITKPDVVDKIIEFCHYEYVVPKGEIFSIGQEEHLEQAVAFFKLFYYAKDFDTFVKFAKVAKFYINEGLFLYTVSVAVVHRTDCYGLILPPIHELHPWYFFNADVIQQAYKHALHDSVGGTVHHTVHANYSGHYVKLHPEQSLSYYLEDVGVNGFLYYFHIFYPFWMDGEEFHINKDKRGELTLDVIHSITSRFYLERLCNSMGDIPILDFHVPIEMPYYSSLQYHTGDFFPERPNHVDLHDSKLNSVEVGGYKYQQSFSTVHQCEDRISVAVDSGIIVTKDGKLMKMYEDPHSVDIFGNLLHANMDSPNHDYYCSYLAYAKHLLGYAHTSISWHHVVPSVLDHPETCLRDPAVYSIYKKILIYYQKFQHHLKPYTKEELVYPGVTIQKVEMDRLITYFDKFYSYISEVVPGNTQVWAVQDRLNHKPFTFKIHVNSNQDTQAMVKVFLGPKYDEYGNTVNVTVNSFNFVPIDSFKWHLQPGQNVIKRSSHESEYYGTDKTTTPLLQKKVTEALKGTGKFHVTGEDNYYFFPHRFMLPKGTVGGFPCQFYFYIYPYKAAQGSTEEPFYFYPHPGTGGGYIDAYPTYYPLDKPIKYEKLFVEEIPNSYFYDTKVYLRTIEEAQVKQDQQPF